jgi:serine protease AprX
MRRGGCRVDHRNNSKRPPSSTGGPGFTGKGVDVAVIDSGVAPVPGLDGTDKLYHGPDVSFEAQVPELAHLDTYGHGSHMAGIIAGRAANAVSGRYAGDSANFPRDGS